MKKTIALLYSLAALFIFTACENDYGVFNSDNKPEVPVTFPGTTTHGFNPYITRSIADTTSAIEFTLAIPSESPRSIKEITKVAVGASSINPGTAVEGTYISEPILGNGKTATFSTTFQELREAVPAALLASGQEVAFMFVVTLDNGDTIIPVQVRIRFTA